MKDLRVPAKSGEKGFSPEAIEWMKRRTEAFQAATSKKGGPANQMTYGAGKGPLWSEDDAVSE